MIESPPIPPLGRRLVPREFGADPDSVEILRERVDHDRACVAIGYADRDGTYRRGLYGLRWTADRWLPTGAYSTGATGAPDHPVWERHGEWAAGPPDEGVVAGWVRSPQARIVELIDTGDRIVRNEVENGVAMLFFGRDFSIATAWVRALDATGTVLAEGPR